MAGKPFARVHQRGYQRVLDGGGIETLALIGDKMGWTGGAFGTGKRMPIRATRALLTAALDGSLNRVEFRKDPNFGFEVPVAVPGVDAQLLDPRQTWADPAAYDAQARKLVSMFSDNFAQYADKIDDDVRAAAIG